MKLLKVWGGSPTYLHVILSTLELGAYYPVNGIKQFEVEGDNECEKFFF